MSAATIGTDEEFDNFIRQQKLKVQQDKHSLEENRVGRKKWDTSNERQTRLAEQRNLRTPPEQGLPIGKNSHEARQKQLAAERKQEYNQMLSQKPAGKNMTLPVSPRGAALPLGEYEEKRARLALERREELRKHLEQKQSQEKQKKKHRQHQPDTARGENELYDYSQVNREFNDQRRKEYEKFVKQKEKQSRRMVTPETERMGLPLGERNEDKKKTLQEERHKEYEKMLKQKMDEESHQLEMRKREHDEFLKKLEEMSPRREEQERRRPPENVQNYDQEQRRPPDDRRNDYNDRMKEKELPKQKPAPSGNGALALKGEYEGRKEKLDEERKKDYQEYLAKKQSEIDERQRKKPPPPQAPQPSKYDYPEERQAPQREQNNIDRAKGNAPRNADDVEDMRKKLGDEKQREYQDFLDMLNNNAKSRNQPNEDGGLPIGQFRYEERLKKMQEERRKDYNEMLAQKKEKERTREQERKENIPPPSPRGFNKLGGSDRDKEQLAEQRKQEYNTYLHEKDKGRDNRKPASGGTLPIPERNSAQNKKREERNKEYREFLQLQQEKERRKREQQRPPEYGRQQQNEPPKNFGSPSYEEMLEKKRREESDYRKMNDPGYDRLEEQNRYRDSRTLNDGRFGEGILEDDNWLSPARLDRGAQYADMIHTPQRGSYSKSPDHILDNQLKWDSLAKSPIRSPEPRLNQDGFSRSHNHFSDNWQGRNGSHNAFQENYANGSDLNHKNWSPEPRLKQDSFSRSPNHYQESLQNHNNPYNGFQENRPSRADVYNKNMAEPEYKTSRGPDRSKEYITYDKFY